MSALPKLAWGRPSREKASDDAFNSGLRARALRASVGRLLQQQADAVYAWGDRSAHTQQEIAAAVGHAQGSAGVHGGASEWREDARPPGKC